MATTTADRLEAIEAKLDALAVIFNDLVRQAGYIPTERLLELRREELASRTLDPRLAPQARSAADRLLAAVDADAAEAAEKKAMELNRRRVRKLKWGMETAAQLAEDARDKATELATLRLATDRADVLRRYAGMTEEELLAEVFGDNVAAFNGQTAPAIGCVFLRELWREVEQQVKG